MSGRIAFRAFRVLLIFAIACTQSNNGNGGGGGDDGSGGGGGGSGGGGSGGSDGSNGSGGGGSGESAGLTFAIIGDTRPASIDDTANYPSAIVTKIFTDIAAVSPAVSFVVGTGDYQYASTTGSEQAPQIDKYMTARAGFSGPFYPAMGNHECTGYTDSNCGSGNPDGITKNYTTFISTMLSPIGQSEPYYVETVAASDSSWTAKLVVVSCNAWTTAESTWLTQQLAVATTYTFVVRHESVADMSQTKCTESQTIIGKNPLTLLIVGHTHEYSHEASDKEIINGIGGAPLTSGTNYGYTIINRNSDGTLTVTTYDYSTGKVIDTFKIQASGAAA
ncbi:MAG TPA: metallophosphoesterase [Kofleriaceae bacterium]|jgi:hypothetical protein|nr:metallophosphoesterase [Kofleriaceae bacterium]